VPNGRHFFVEFRSSERAFFYSNDPELLEHLYSKLAAWEPTKEDPAASHNLSVSCYETAQRLIAEGDLAGAIEQFRSALAADPEFYAAAHGLIGALQEIGYLDEAISIARRLIEFSPEDDVAQETLSFLCKRKASMEGEEKTPPSPGA
jgi:tetratricopeptide (TPR) repeat protein